MELEQANQLFVPWLELATQPHLHSGEAGKHKGYFLGGGTIYSLISGLYSLNWITLPLNYYLPTIRSVYPNLASAVIPRKRFFTLSDSGQDWGRPRDRPEDMAVRLAAGKMFLKVQKCLRKTKATRNRLEKLKILF